VIWILGGGDEDEDGLIELLFAFICI